MISDNSSSDNDTVTINETGAVPAGLITGVENIEVELESFTGQTVDAQNFTGGTVTLSQTQTGGADTTTVNNVAAPLDIVAGSDIDGALTVDLDDTADTDGASINASNGADVSVGDVTENGLTITVTDGATVNLKDDNNGDTDDAASIIGDGTVTVDPESANTEVVDNLDLSGDGAAVTYDVTDAATPADTINTLELKGDQDITVIASSKALSGHTITDSTTAGTTTLEVDSANTLDLTNADADLFDLTKDFSGNAVTVSDGDNVRLSNVAQTSQTTISAGSAGDNTLNLNLRVNADDLKVTDGDFGTVNLDVENNDDTNDPRAIGTTSNFGANTTVNVTGSDDLDIGNVTADVIDANGFTGALTAELSGTNGDITGGSGDDVFSSIGNAAATVSGGEGEDEFTIAAEGNDVTINGGADTDTVKLGTGVNLDFSDDAGTPAALDLNGVEILDFDGGSMLTVDGSEIDGADLIVRSTGGTNDTFTVNLGSTPSVDLSNLTVNTGEVDVVVNGTGVSDTVTGSNDGDLVDAKGGDDEVNAGAGQDEVLGKGGADTINGGAGNDNQDLNSDSTFGLQGGAGDDSIDGGAGDDILVGGADSDTLTGGTGDDEFVFNAFANDNGNVITDFTAGGTEDSISGLDTQVSDSTATGDITSTGTFNENEIDGGDVTADNGLEIVVDGSSTGNTANSLSEADVATFLGDVDGEGNGFVDNNSSDAVFFVGVTDGTDTGIFAVEEDGNNAAIEESELTEVVTLQGVSDPTNLTADDFANFTA